MSSKGQTHQRAYLDLILNAQPIANVADNAAASPLTDLYVALHTSDPGETGVQTTNECAYTGYARVQVARTAGGWVRTNDTMNPAANIDFPEATGGSETATHFSVGRANAGAGEIFYYGPISPTIAISSGVTPRLTTATAITED